MLAQTFKAQPAAAILDAIRALPDAYRETLILRLVEGMTGPEIAARTGLTHGSVRVNLHRARKEAGPAYRGGLGCIPRAGNTSNRTRDHERERRNEPSERWPNT